MSVLPIDQPAASGGVANLGFSAILAGLRSRIVNGLLVDPSNVPVCAAPNDKIHEYFSQGGFVLRPRAADPDALSGAARYGYVLSRTVDIFVVTESLIDTGGNDYAAVAAHCDREDELVDVVLLNPPIDTPQGGIAVGKTIAWVPGGEDIMREVQTDAGLIASCLCFSIMYPAKPTVFRN